jgi:hypothetical protein
MRSKTPSVIERKVALKTTESRVAELHRANRPATIGLIIRQKKPKGLETPLHQEDSFLTPTERFYVRHHSEQQGDAMADETTKDADVILKADGLAARRLLITLWLGFGSYVAALFLIIPEYTGLARDAWLTVTLGTFAGAVAGLFRALAAFRPVRLLAPAQSSAAKGNVSAPPTTSRPEWDRSYARC